MVTRASRKRGMSVEEFQESTQEGESVGRVLFNVLSDLNESSFGDGPPRGFLGPVLVLLKPMLKFFSEKLGFDYRFPAIYLPAVVEKPADDGSSSEDEDAKMDRLPPLRRRMWRYRIGW